MLTGFFHVRIKPETLQLPITGKCNSQCTTCNVWKQKERCDISPEGLKKVLQDEYLINVKYVGLNGGEPFLHSQFIEIIKDILQLPKIKAIYIITNGIMTERIKTVLPEVNALCKDRGVVINLTISIDGVNEVYSIVRGVPAFDKVCDTVKEIASSKDNYCNNLTIGTTISRANVAYISSVKILAEELKVKANYHLAVPNRRIFTTDEETYTVFHDLKSKSLATELFFGLYKYSTTLKEKLLYFQNYYFLLSDGNTRISACNYRFQDLTIDENLNLYYCARESHQLGNLKENTIRQILKAKKAKEELRRIAPICHTCGHYITLPTLKGMVLFIRETLKPGVWVRYQVESWLLRVLS